MIIIPRWILNALRFIKNNNNILEEKKTRADFISDIIYFYALKTGRTCRVRYERRTNYIFREYIHGRKKLLS